MMNNQELLKIIRPLEINYRYNFSQDEIGAIGKLIEKTKAVSKDLNAVFERWQKYPDNKYLPTIHDLKTLLLDEIENRKKQEREKKVDKNPYIYPPEVIKEIIGKIRTLLENKMRLQKGENRITMEEYINWMRLMEPRYPGCGWGREAQRLKSRRAFDRNRPTQPGPR